MFFKKYIYAIFYFHNRLQKLGVKKASTIY